MKVSIISVVAGGAALAGALAISACSTLEVDSAGSPPVPRTQPGSHTEIAYVLQKGKWHQLRIDMVAKGPRLNSDGDAYHLHLRSVASVWQFNRRTGDYDIRLSPHESPSAEQGMRFSFYRGPTVDRLQMSPGNGGGGGGAAGWPEHNFTEIELKVVGGFESVQGVEVEDASEGIVFLGVEFVRGFFEETSGLTALDEMLGDAVEVLLKRLPHGFHFECLQFAQMLLVFPHRHRGFVAGCGENPSLERAVPE